MTVSFIVPLYNCLPLTQAMVASLRASLPTGLEHEIVLVDDGSTDGTREWLAGLATPFRVALNEQNLGYGGANNRGAALARGEFLVLLNNDLLLPPRWLEPMLAAHRRLGARAGLIGNVQRDARTGAIDHAGIFINHKGKPEHIRRLPPVVSRLIAPVRRRTLLTGACLLLARSLWEELGGFDEGYHNGCEDVDLCLRAAGAGRINAVALRSRVRHHVSSAPGRKVRDEANTYRLTLRWRETLVLLGLRDWCRFQFEAYLREPREVADTRFALGILAYLERLRPAPPPAAYAGMRAAIEGEIARWQAMFPDAGLDRR